MIAQETSKPRLLGWWLTSYSNPNMLKALGSIPRVLTNKTKLLDPCLDPASEQEGSRFCVSSTMLPPCYCCWRFLIPLRPLPSRRPLKTGLATTHTANLYVFCEDVPIESVEQMTWECNVNCAVDTELLPCTRQDTECPWDSVTTQGRTEVGQNNTVQAGIWVYHQAAV